MAGELWLAEGVTSYYGPLAMRRAGSPTFGTSSAGWAVTSNSVVFDPGRRLHSPRDMSMMAPFVDAATSIDRTNFPNTFISYYTWGAALGLALDLALRERFPGVTMDDFMSEMWRTHGKTERAYTNADARAALGRVTRDTAFANAWWRSYVDGRDAPDYAALLAPAGVVARQAAADVAWLGDQGFRLQNEKVVVGGNALMGQPLYEAGLDRGDIINALDGQQISTVADIEQILGGKKPGDAVQVSFESRGENREASIALRASPRLELVPFESAGRDVTDAIRAFRAAWVGSKAK